MAVIKTVGQSGQIALGKAYAGRHVLVGHLLCPSPLLFIP